MSVNLQKGQKISLVKPGEPGLKRIMVGLGWDEVEQKRGWFAPKPQDIDCDASVILCGADGRIISNDIKTCCVYFGNLVHSSGAIVHQGDNLTGAGDGDDEQIMVDLPNIPANIDKLVFARQHLRCERPPSAFRPDSQCLHSLGGFVHAEGNLPLQPLR